jgi:hypothetical protein
MNERKKEGIHLIKIWNLELGTWNLELEPETRN